MERPREFTEWTVDYNKPLYLHLTELFILVWMGFWIGVFRLRMFLDTENYTNVYSRTVKIKQWTHWIMIIVKFTQCTELFQ